VATNYKDSGGRVTLKAAAERTSGVPCIDENIAGVPQTTAAANALYPSALEGVWEVPFIENSLKGDRVDIHLATNALSRVAYGGAVVAGTRPFATIFAVPGDGETEDTGQAPVTGKMWIKILPQAIAIVLEAIKITVVQAGEAGKDQKDTVTLPAGVTGGTFTLKAEGEETAAIKFNATAAEVKAALEAKAKLTENVEVTGEPGGPYTVEFIEGLKEKAIALTASGASLLP
jgi:hypothetical protein